MPIFTYRARSKDGTLIKGTSDAVDVDTVARYLRNLGYSIVSIEIESKWQDFYREFLQKVRGVRYQEVVFFTRQLAALLASGVALDAALNSVAGQLKNLRFRKIIEEIISDIQKGLSFSDALTRHPRVFSQVYTSMIKVAETAGILDKILERLAGLGLQEIEIRTRIRSVLTYPVILVGLSICVVSYLLAAVVPKFVVIFSTYGVKLPLATRLLLNISLIAKYFWFVILAGSVAAVYFLRKYLRSPQGRYNIDSFILRFPVLGNFYLKMQLARLTRTISALIKSGVPLLEALAVTQRTVKNTVINRVIQDTRISISEGKSMAEPLNTSAIFPPMVIQMVSVGEKTGRLDQMLSDVANHYDQEIEYAIRNISSTLEPVLLLIMGLMVAFIALAILSPIFNLIRVFRS